MNNINIQPASKNDLKGIVELLTSNQLPTIDISESSVQLFAATVNNQLIGSIGIEKYNQIGLLRSLAVESKYKNQKVGERLIQYLLDFCINEKITELYLLTTTAEKYFDKFGFHQIERNNVPEKIVQTREFNDICPLSAVVMKKKL
jgi:amino-acid N-acetyltransferase